MGRMGQGNSNSSQISGSDFLSDSFKNHEWNFPGLRKNVAASPSEQQNSIEQEIKSADQDGIKEIVLLQQRTVLQVIKNICLLTYLDYVTIGSRHFLNYRIIHTDFLLFGK